MLLVGMYVCGMQNQRGKLPKETYANHETTH